MELNSIVKAVGDFAWGPLMIVFLVGTGLYLTVRMRFIQFKGFFHSIALISGKYDNHEDEGEITHFQALCTALSATIGTGNIAGVATAIASGGPGAVFWMWLTALVGMATKFTSCTLSQIYRRIRPDGSVSGGPMYYLEMGMKSKGLGVVFAFLALIASFGIGNMVQANSVVGGMKNIMPEKWITNTVGGLAGINSDNLFLNIPLYKALLGLLLAFLVGVVIIGGVRRIAVVASYIVPLMAIVYIVGSLIIIFKNMAEIPKIILLIFQSAFTPAAAVGGFAGATVTQIMRYGVARGVFSNESGLGSAPMAHAAAKTRYPVREGLVAMLGPFIDTIVICSMTAFVILLSGQWSSGANGAELSSKAYDYCLAGYGDKIVSFGLVFFAFSTMISWSYYGDRCAQYLFGDASVKVYRWMFIFFIFVGATIRLEMVWNISDAMNGLMAIPNLIGLLFLSGVVARESAKYFAEDKGKVDASLPVESAGKD